jgi:hypothetical protein
MVVSGLLARLGLFGVCKAVGRGIFGDAGEIGHGVSFAQARQPTQMYSVGFEYVFSSSEIALAVTIFFAILSQIKINVTNAYAGALD